MEKVSVLIPCYNDGKYLKETFASIASQTWKNLEVIVVDDGSDDQATVDMLERLRHEGTAIVLHQERQGPAAARNKAVKASSGSYILFLDADDRIAPTYIAKALEVMRTQPQAGVCYCHAELFGEMCGPWELPAYSLQKMLVDNVVFVTALMRRTVFEQVGGFDESFRTGMEDYDFFLSVLEKEWEIVQLPETLFFYRIKTGSRSRQFLANQKDYYAVYQRLFDKHQALYAAHWRETIPAFREQLLVQRKQISMLENQIHRQTGIITRVFHRVRRILEKRNKAHP